LRSFRTKVSQRRATYLRLVGQIEGQLREAYHRRFREKKITQSSLADKLGVGRSVVNRRLSGQRNMTIETIADMVWGLGHAIEVKIYDPSERMGANFPDPTTSGGLVEITPDQIGPSDSRRGNARIVLIEA
jgi:Helix-turn-helix